MGMLQRSDSMSECPYNGDGQYCFLAAGPRRVEDVGRSLPHPLPEGLAAAEHLCFDEMAMYVLVRRQDTWWLSAGRTHPSAPAAPPDRTEDDAAECR